MQRHTEHRCIFSDLLSLVGTRLERPVEDVPCHSATAGSMACPLHTSGALLAGDYSVPQLTSVAF